MTGGQLCTVLLLLPQLTFAASPYKNSLFREIVSKPIRINARHAAMMGPTSFDVFNLDKSIKDDFVWITEYNVEVTDKAGAKGFEKFLCHANVGVVQDSPKLDPKKIKFMAKNDDVDMRSLLAMGQGSMGGNFPAGFGLKLHNSSDRKVIVGGQLQNEFDPNIDKEMVLHYKIGYMGDKAARAAGLVPLWPIRFVVKVDLKEGKNLAAHAHHHGDEKSPGMIDKNSYLDFRGSSTNKTGHWLVPPGTHIYEKHHKADNRTYRAHFMTAHLHAYADWVELYDKTAKKTIWKGKAKTAPDGPYLTESEHFSSEEGVVLEEGHEFVSRVQYTNPTPKPIDAMATINVYVACHENIHPLGCAP